MPASKSELPVGNPSALIRSRIGEKRIFEARFLYRQLGAEIGDKERNALERELSGSLEQVKKLQQQAREYIEQGQNTLAVKLYLDIEQIAIDVPGLAEEKKALAGADALVARMTSKIVEREPEILLPTVTPAAAGPVQPPVVAVKPARQRWSRWWLFVGLAGLAVVLLLCFRNVSKEKSISVTPSPSPALIAPTQKILIRPLTTSSPTTSNEPQPDKEATQSEPDVETMPSSAPSLQVAPLQIQKSVTE